MLLWLTQEDSLVLMQDWYESFLGFSLKGASLAVENCLKSRGLPFGKIGSLETSGALNFLSWLSPFAGAGLNWQSSWSDSMLPNVFRIGLGLWSSGRRERFNTIERLMVMSLRGDYWVVVWADLKGAVAWLKRRLIIMLKLIELIVAVSFVSN